MVDKTVKFANINTNNITSNKKNLFLKMVNENPFELEYTSTI